MNEDRLFHETEKKKGLSIKLENLFSLGGKTFLYIYKKKKDEKPNFGLGQKRDVELRFRLPEKYKCYHVVFKLL